MVVASNPAIAIIKTMEFKAEKATLKFRFYRSIELVGDQYSVPCPLFIFGQGGNHPATAFFRVLFSCEKIRLLGKLFETLYT